MIVTNKSPAKNTYVSDHKLNKSHQPKLIARWKTVNDKLVCQWVKV